MPIDVRQGYAKCSIVVVDEDSIITYDQGIAAQCRRLSETDSDYADLSVLLVNPGNVTLQGYSTGFIGGTSGRVGNHTIFNGDLMAHPQGNLIKEFIESRGLKCSWFDWPLTDIGSII